ncbi:MAG: response regulator transcription factor [Erysipelotrichaceae bacterium]|nr:response regulator transcription factor [Erysipelotrichaceae bacterium]
MKSIFIVEDEKMVAQELSSMLEKEGYDAILAEDFTDVTESILMTGPDLLLLDINLPGKSGYQILREVKRRSAIPIVVLTSRDQLPDELHALELGADEFITKPYRKERLLLRIANVLRRYEGRKNMLEGPGFLLDRGTYTLYIDGTSVLLPKNQGKILETLMARTGEVVPKEEICEAVWGTSEFIDENALQVNLTRLKKTLSSLPMKVQISSERGIGYKLEDRS